MVPPNDRTHAPPRSEVDDARYLLVAGSYRSGSTALFQYLSVHPQVSAARVKETCFFLPVDEETPSEYRAGRDSLASYASLFAGPVGHQTVRVEASPGYLYYAETARAIKSALPNARIVVSLREQVAWLISWFKTLKALSLLEAALDFDEFIDAQVTDTRPWRQRPHGYRAVDHGYYAKFVEQYVDVFGADKVLVTWFDDLTNTPRDVMRKVCTFASLDPAAYDSYEFRRVNPSVKLRSQRSHEIYSRLRRGTVRLASVRPRTSEAVKRLLPRIDARFYALITEAADEVQPSPATSSMLKELYADDNRRLATIVGAPVPWAAER